LEAETLPQYFRHNRFQSLVRQLNFYSFRKINRERNVWIYKHKLFHRDHPEDLHLVRRRTCPGLDGRKQRFSRFSARKLTDTGSGSEEDESSVEEVALNEILSSSDGSLKRDLDSSGRELSDSKRGRKMLNLPETVAKNIFVDTSMLTAAATAAEEADDVASQVAAKDERLEMAEQSLVVSQVSKKLEQYAKRASYGGVSAKARRGGSGVVTPPFGSTQTFPLSALLTYDDEYMGKEGEPVVTDSESMSLENHQLALAGLVTPEKKLMTAMPVENIAAAQSIVFKLLDSKSDEMRSELVAPTSVLGFCVATAPQGDKDLCSKILQLLASCEDLARDFHTYRAALRPYEADAPWTSRGRTLQQIWYRESSRVEAVRDFKTFAVNLFQKFLASDNNNLALDASDMVILRRVAEAWVQSL
jgi:hypothetical protein